jgi:hypothetical protein
MFSRSLPGEPGTPEERISQLEHELKKTNGELAALRVTSSEEWRSSGPSFRDELRKIADDIRDGRPVRPEDLIRLTQPVLRDLSPLFDRMRVRGEKVQIEAMTGELARKYDLTRNQQMALAKWLQAKSEENARRWSALVTQKAVTFHEIVQASNDLRLDEGLDEFMATQLRGEKLRAFQAERMDQRMVKVQKTADRAVARLDSMVALDEAQRDQVFGVAARLSRDYVPGMQVYGAEGAISVVPQGEPRDAILAVLRPDQRVKYEQESTRLIEAARKDAAEIGVSLPERWDPLNDIE